MIVHAGLAASTSAPELLIDKQEADLLATASANLLAQFNIAPDPKTQAIIGFVMACGTVYGPRAIMIRARVAQQRKEGEGVAGVYDSNGTAAGTTAYSAGPVN